MDKAESTHNSDPESEQVAADHDVEAGRKLDRENSSQLEAHEDPFTPREGKTLVWKNVNMTLVNKHPLLTSMCCTVALYKPDAIV
jgi:hypothetical protein